MGERVWTVVGVRFENCRTLKQTPFFFSTCRDGTEFVLKPQTSANGKIVTSWSFVVLDVIKEDILGKKSLRLEEVKQKKFPFPSLFFCIIGLDTIFYVSL